MLVGAGAEDYDKYVKDVMIAFECKNITSSIWS